MRIYSLSKGFTLVEVLVVTIIIGMLSSIALPGFLNQAAKARGSEAKSILGAINRSQQSYRWENNTFANTISKLDIKFEGRFFQYRISNSSSLGASSITINNQDGLKVYSSGITQQPSQFSTVICESNGVYNKHSIADAPIGGNGAGLSCPNNYRRLN